MMGTANEDTRSDRASTEGLRERVTKAMPDIVAAMPWYDESFPDYTEAIDAIVDALRDTGPRSDSDRDCLEIIDMWRERALRAEDALALSGPRPDRADRVCVHGTDTSEECPECGFGFSTPRTETPDSTPDRADPQPCLFVPPHEPFYCRIHADVRLRLTDERCRTGERLATPESGIKHDYHPDRPYGPCSDCGWHPKHSRFAALSTPRTEGEDHGKA